MSAAAQVALRGPLSTALGQWAFLGFGTFVIFTGDNGVSRAAREIAGIALKLTTGKDYALLLSEASLAKGLANNNNNQAPIVIHNIQPSDGSRSNGNLLSRGGWTGTLIHLTLVSGTCWTAYIIFSQFLPEQIKELLPVTRKYFEGAVTSLGQGIIRVRDALGEQIKNLGIKTDLLAAKQDDTHSEVLGLKDDIGDVRLNIDDIAVAISRCESSLDDAAGRQTYMSRGVRLLVQCVGDIMRNNNNPAIADELDHFANLSADQLDSEFYYKDGGVNTPMAKETRAVTTYNPPLSPNLSEIGSINDDSSANRPIPMSLPRPHRQPPQSQAGNVSASSSKATQGFVSSSPFGTPGGPLQMLRKMNSRPVMSSSSRQGSCPEDEVPQTDKDNGLPGLDEVDNLLKVIRMGEVPAGV
mmetsp:Transcript_29270/g.46011  ORF Transcript_29270/g.46011 Transcript_29270/m.46011 type:complete len:412 (-) Transcript_29270:107-1342(-)|eukprot:CAMPEP_0201714398 /NCGR_PEP_ID=MMETSP0593-20130828/899_1 /ASSEMBLY_ACC=CAM_ASM_000672 /TAXON_ID=267983 /ORGANISM="Skeletonema japonicum, Strain CCMP2506" /LENGTH=411 /DNA_ID=CAMNT_0048203675 /DNA_START=503 /DNA_END=1738 /DNA_ORIENTATION=-